MTTPKVNATSTVKGTSTKTSQTMSPQDLKTLFEALNIAPQWLSKRFILKKCCGWTDDDISNNAQMRIDEENQLRIGNKTGAFK